MAELLNGLGVRGATVVGHSMGGFVATSLAEQASELVDRVVLIGSPSDAEQSDLPFTAKLATAPVIGEAVWRLAPDSTIKSASSEAFAPGFSAEEAFPENPDQVVDDLDAMTYTSFKDARRGRRTTSSRRNRLRRAWRRSASRCWRSSEPRTGFSTSTT